MSRATNLQNIAFHRKAINRDQFRHQPANFSQNGRTGTNIRHGFGNRGIGGPGLLEHLHRCDQGLLDAIVLCRDWLQPSLPLCQLTILDKKKKHHQQHEQRRDRADQTTAPEKLSNRNHLGAFQPKAFATLTQQIKIQPGACAQTSAHINWCHSIGI